MSLPVLSSAFMGGFLSGGFHALTGPDHIAALLPVITGRSWAIGFILGSLWGFGHGCVASTAAIFGFMLKDQLLDEGLLHRLACFTDMAIGITLVLIGLLGLNEASQFFPSQPPQHIEEEERKKGEAENSMEILTSNLEIGATKQPDEDPPRFGDSQPSLASSLGVSKLFAVFLNGCLLGLSWDGLPSLAPVFSLHDTPSLSSFLVSYTLGTVLTIALACALIAKSTHYFFGSTSPANKVSREEAETVLSALSPLSISASPSAAAAGRSGVTVSMRLCLASSYISIITGLFVIAQATIKGLSSLYDEQQQQGGGTTAFYMSALIQICAPIAIVCVLVLTLTQSTILHACFGTCSRAFSRLSFSAKQHHSK